MKCVVIGSGIAGIATAIRLAAKGHEVDVYEANNYPGGKLRELNLKGYRFDLGPTVFTAPYLLDELFELCGKNPRDYFSYSQPEVIFNYFFEDGSKFIAYSDLEKFKKEVEEKTEDSAETLESYLEDVAIKYKITNEVFIENSLHILKNYFKKSVLYGVLNFHRINAFITMDKGNRKFFKDPRLIQIFNNYASYVGSSPFIAPATLNVIQHLEINMGTYIPDKGMYSIVNALVRLAEEEGVSFHYNKKVERILVEKREVKGIQIKGEKLLYDRVVSNMDVNNTYKYLIPEEKKPLRILSQPKSCSIIGFFWGINRVYPDLDLHNMLFTANEKEEFRTIFEDYKVYEDPTLYICIMSKHVKEVAPESCENWFVMITGPNDQGQDWELIIKEARKNAVAKINRMLNTDIEKEIDCEYVLSPEIIRDMYSASQGAIYGNSSNSRFAAFLRHPNFSRKIKGLFFAGGTVHPGAGIPMCLNSAKIVEKVFS